MRLANAHGDDLGVLRAYQRCGKVPGEIDAQPTATRQFAGQLRRYHALRSRDPRREPPPARSESTENFPNGRWRLCTAQLLAWPTGESRHGGAPSPSP